MEYGTYSMEVFYKDVYIGSGSNGGSSHYDSSCGGCDCEFNDVGVGQEFFDDVGFENCIEDLVFEHLAENDVNEGNGDVLTAWKMYNKMNPDKTCVIYVYREEGNIFPPEDDDVDYLVTEHFEDISQSISEDVFTKAFMSGIVR